VKRVKAEYAQFPIETLIEKTEKIKKDSVHNILRPQ